MQSFLSKSKTVSLGSIAFLCAGMLTIAIPHRTLAADDDNEFGMCAKELLGTGLSGEQAGTACADALHPEDLSSCVGDIMKAQTPISAEDALQACYRVRRPLELANCVTQIDENATIEESNATLVLDTCRRSLLPERHSACVVGLSSNITDISLEKAIETCIDAEAFPVELFPTSSDG
jgi:hypothetical protein